MQQRRVPPPRPRRGSEDPGIGVLVSLAFGWTDSHTNRVSSLEEGAEKCGFVFEELVEIYEEEVADRRHLFLPHAGPNGGILRMAPQAYIDVSSIRSEDRTPPPPVPKMFQALQHLVTGRATGRLKGVQEINGYRYLTDAFLAVGGDFIRIFPQSVGSDLLIKGLNGIIYGVLEHKPEGMLNDSPSQRAQLLNYLNRHSIVVRSDFNNFRLHRVKEVPIRKWNIKDILDRYEAGQRNEDDARHITSLLLTCLSFQVVDEDAVLSSLCMSAQAIKSDAGGEALGRARNFLESRLCPDGETLEVQDRDVIQLITFERLSVALGHHNGEMSVVLRELRTLLGARAEALIEFLDQNPLPREDITRTIRTPEILQRLYEGFLKFDDPEMRKAMGAYYTDPSLAKAVIAKVTHRKPLDQLSIIDPACGTGVWVIAWIRHVHQTLTPHEFELWVMHGLKHIVGIDRNPVAYLLARLGIAMEVRALLGKEVALNRLPQIHLADTLADVNAGSRTDPMVPAMQQEALKALLSKYDGVIGNHPWGEVKFKSAYKANTQALVGKIQRSGNKNKDAPSRVIGNIATHFLALSLERLLAKEGFLAILAPGNLTTLPSWANIRHTLGQSFHEAQISNLGGGFREGLLGVGAFKDVTAPACAVVGNGYHLPAPKGLRVRAFSGTTLSELVHAFSSGEGELVQPDRAPPQIGFTFHPKRDFFLERTHWSGEEHLLFDLTSTGPVTSQDEDVIALHQSLLEDRIERLKGGDLEAFHGHKEWRPKEVQEQLLSGALRPLFVPILFRRFETRSALYGRPWMQHPRQETMTTQILGQNKLVLMWAAPREGGVDRTTPGFYHATKGIIPLNTSLISGQGCRIGWTGDGNVSPLFLKMMSDECGRLTPPEDAPRYVLGGPLLHTPVPAVPQPGKDTETRIKRGEKVATILCHEDWPHLPAGTTFVPLGSTTPIAIGPALYDLEDEVLRFKIDGRLLIQDWVLARNRGITPSEAHHLFMMCRALLLLKRHAAGEIDLLDLEDWGPLMEAKVPVKMPETPLPRTETGGPPMRVGDVVLVNAEDFLGELAMYHPAGPFILRAIETDALLECIQDGCLSRVPLASLYPFQPGKPTTD